MANYTTVFSGGYVYNQVKKIVVDTKADLDSINTSQLMAGSKAFVINTS